MASPAKVIEGLPTTLPEDFIAWDDAVSPSTQPDQPAAAERYPGLRVVPFRAETTDPKSTGKKRLIIACSGTALLVLLSVAMIPMLSHRPVATAKPSAIPKPVEPIVPLTPAIQSPQNAAAKPTLSTPASGPIRSARVPNVAQATPTTAPLSDRQSASPSPVQARMMSEQLDAPARIHLAAPLSEQAPPPSATFATADIDAAGNNALGSVFSSTKGPRISAASPKLVNVSPGVTFGLLIQKKPPVYPPLAKRVGVFGTVVLAASISRTGIPESLRVVSGPAMLREAAIDAVRNWRYRPYMLNGRPTEIETTITVSFSLDK